MIDTPEIVMSAAGTTAVVRLVVPRTEIQQMMRLADWRGDGGGSSGGNEADRTGSLARGSHVCDNATLCPINLELAGN